MTRHIALTLLLVWTASVSALTDTTSPKNLRLIHKNHFGLSLGGPGFFGPYYEHFLIKIGVLKQVLEDF
jgi:hypothetical protein